MNYISVVLFFVLIPKLDYVITLVVLKTSSKETLYEKISKLPLFHKLHRVVMITSPKYNFVYFENVSVMAVCFIVNITKMFCK